ncbi:Histone methylation protein, partial [Phytophthora megakarya]
MRTSFLDGEDKQLVSLALEYESAGKRIAWDDLATPLQAGKAETAIQDIYGGVSATEVRQKAGKTDENAGELLPTAVSSIIQMIGDLKASD